MEKKKKILFIDQAARIRATIEYLQDFYNFECEVLNINRQQNEEILDEIKDGFDAVVVELFYFLTFPDVVEMISQKIFCVVAFTTLMLPHYIEFNRMLADGVIKLYLKKPEDLEVIAKCINEILMAP